MCIDSGMTGLFGCVYLRSVFVVCSGEKLVYAVDIVVRITYFDFDTKKV